MQAATKQEGISNYNKQEGVKGAGPLAGWV